MAKFSKTIQHDYMRFQVTFANGTKIKGNFSRNGGNRVSVEPENLQLAKDMSIVFWQNDQKMRQDAGWNLGQTFPVVERVAAASKTAEEFIDGLKAGIGVSGELDLAADRPERTKASARKEGRGWTVDVHFESGERYNVSIKGKSISYAMKPDLSALSDSMCKIAFGAMAIMQPEDLAERLKDAAEESASMTEWIETFRARLVPGGPRP